MEWLFRSLKTEWVPELGYDSLDEVKNDFGIYLMAYYNWERPHSKNDGLPPAIRERQRNLLSEVC